MTDPRLQDVALRAGVSMATASYVLRGSPEARISSGTRARVRAAADEIGYRLRAPHRIHGVLLLAPEPAEQVAPGFVAAITESAWTRGLVTVLLPGDGATAREAAIAVREDGLRTVGIVRVTDGAVDEPLGAPPARPFAPTVRVDLTHGSAGGAEGEAVLVPDDRQAARRVVATLRDAGHHRLALAAVDRHPRLTALWCAGFADVRCGPVPVLEPAATWRGDTSSPLHRSIDRHDRPTAVVLLGEPTPASVERLAMQIGSAPEDLVVVVRGGAGRDPVGSGGWGQCRVALPVPELARAALQVLDRSRSPSGHEDRTRHVTRIRFPDASFPEPPARVARRAHLHTVGMQVSAR